MSARRVLALVPLAVAVAGCATTGTQTSTGSITTNCKEIDLTNVSLEPTPLDSWEPKPVKPGFLHIHYSWPATSDGPVYAVGILYESFQKQTVAFIVGPMMGFPQDFDPQAKDGGPRNARTEWGTFFNKLHKVAEYAHPGGMFCSGGGCGKPPDSPPPEFPGVGSSGSAGGFGALLQTSPQMYAQIMRPRLIMSDAVFGESSNRGNREAAIKEVARNTCHGVQAFLGKE